MSVQRMKAPSICRVDRVTKFYLVKQGFFATKASRLRALYNVTLDIRSREILGLVGESGCGKSTLARMVLGLESPSSGHVFFEGRSLASLSKRELRDFRKRAQMVFQDPFSSLNPKKTIFQIISQPLRIHNICPKKELREHVQMLLEMAGLKGKDVMDRYPHEFSGGQRQRIGIARALATEPDLVVLDEPTSALDVSIQAQIINLILDLQESRKLSCLFISHDLPIVEFVSHRIAVMYRGSIVEIMPKEALGLTAGNRYGGLHHPYTSYLLSAVPLPEPPKRGVRPEYKRQRPVSIEEMDGLGMSKLERGCSFWNKCPGAMPWCKEHEPALVQVDKGHYIACHRVSH